ncbi:hypothetical protein HNQ79_006585 [Streptomyces candidus]|uniref:Uncharacterized protein n=1 Tax=Streptomyces candidus TaxID=67283 RepID=A0A7X0HLT6_9ACTN|nr:hypothetical protein [Streptomyces candidus]
MLEGGSEENGLFGFLRCGPADPVPQLTVPRAPFGVTAR